MNDPNPRKPVAWLYCQHGFGLGHFKRSLAVARAIATRFDVVFINGGDVPAGIALPAEIHFLHLPALDPGLHAQHRNADRDALMAARRESLDCLIAESDPSLLVVELYPFGRKKFAAEIDHLIANARDRHARIVCSVRDILVSNRDNQQRHDDRAAAKLNADFDAVMVHADPRLARIEQSFRPTIPLRCPVHYTGYVRPGESPSISDFFSSTDALRETFTLVSVGGGIVGEPIVAAAIAAQPMLWSRHAWPMTIVGGPFFPADRWAEMCARAAHVPQISMLKSVPDLGALLAHAGRSLSQCGYNTALEVLEARVPALFVPYAAGAENEQTARAQRLSALGVAASLAEADLDRDTLIAALATLQPPRASQLDLEGATRCAGFLHGLIEPIQKQRMQA